MNSNNKKETDATNRPLLRDNMQHSTEASHSDGAKV